MGEEGRKRERGGRWGSVKIKVFHLKGWILLLRLCNFEYCVHIELFETGAFHSFVKINLVKNLKKETKKPTSMPKLNNTFLRLNFPLFYLPKNGRGYSMETCNDKWYYSETCIIRPPLDLEKDSLYLQVVFISRFIQYMKRTICSKIGSLRIQVVFLDSGHIIQVSL